MSTSKPKASSTQPGIGHNSQSALDGFVEDFHALDRNDVFKKGALLIKAHDTKDYLDWKPVCRERFDISHDDTARNLMAVAKVADKYENFRTLRVKTSTLYKLAGIKFFMNEGDEPEPDHDNLPVIIEALTEAAKAAGRTLSIDAADKVITYAVLRKKHGDFSEAALDALDRIDDPEAVKQLKEKKPETKEEVDALLIGLQRAVVAKLYKVTALPDWLDHAALVEMEKAVPEKHRERLLKKLRAPKAKAAAGEDAYSYVLDVI